MDHRYKGDLNKLQGHEPVGTGECVALVQLYANAARTALWKPGKHVLDVTYIPPGTAIATFASPVALFKPMHGNHAALFINRRRHLDVVARSAIEGKWDGYALWVQVCQVHGTGSADLA